MEKVGKDGVITVEESKGISYETEFVEGMQLTAFISPPTSSTNAITLEAVIEDPTS